MRVLLVGGGGREHALAWRLRQSSVVRELLIAPGNDGMAALGRLIAVESTDVDGLTALAEAERVDLVVVGPEAPLVLGLADRLQRRGCAVFGCSSRAAEIEGSKAFAKAFMARRQIPTAAFGVFSNCAEAERFIDRAAEPLVIKADGLAAGKGVEICPDRREAKAAVRRLLEGGALGAAGQQVVVEEFLSGREVSLMAFVDGEELLPLEPAEDHKTIDDGDRGAMTGGMGVISPTPVLDEQMAARCVREILEPAAAGLCAEGRPFRGLLYAGLMITDRGPYVLEFNCRFGDPETQALMVRLDEDLALLLEAVARGRMPRQLRFSRRAAVSVVMAAAGYPGPYAKGERIDGLELAAAMADIQLFFAGVAAPTGRPKDAGLVTNGGRVLSVTALGDTIAEARRQAYAAVDTIHFRGAHVRRDIGARPQPTRT